MGPVNNNYYFDPTQNRKVDLDRQAPVRPDPETLKVEQEKQFKLKMESVQKKGEAEEARIKKREKEEDKEGKNKKKKDQRFEPGLGKGLMTGPDAARIAEALGEKKPPIKIEPFNPKKPEEQKPSQ